MTTARVRLDADDGFAMIAAICVFLVVSLLVAAAVTIGVQTLGSSRADANRKRALEAAEAGLQIAAYRLNMLDPANASSQNSMCVADGVANPDGTTHVCQSSVTTLGNGSSYQYWTTPVLAPGDTCVGQSLTSTAALAQRCITSAGTANGVTERSEIRVAGFTASPFFQIPGVTGVKSVSLVGNATINGSTGSNGTVSATGNAGATNNVLGPAGTTSTTQNASLGPTTRLAGPIVLDPVQSGSSVSANDDARITNGLAQHPVGAYDQSSGNVSFDPSTRSLSMSGSSSLTLAGAVYNFCSFKASGNAAISLSPGQSAEIIIDSPDDRGSGCPAGSGTFSLSGNATWTNISQSPTALQIFVYGLNDGSNTVTLVGNADFYGVIYAPQSTVNLSGNGAFTGAISGANVNINGNAFNWSPSASTLHGNTTGAYYRTAWAQCSPTAPAPAQPGSGCG